MTRRLSNLRASDFQEHIGADSVFVLPVGAVEQHGPHLPFNTDLLIATACADAVIDRVGADLDLWLLEPLAFTKSNEHAGTPGTFWLGPETLLRVLDELSPGRNSGRASPLARGSAWRWYGMSPRPFRGFRPKGMSLPSATRA
ncbi:MAG: creatininase family protein [Actinomycetota bacterium]|nr:creatininase family protein [Actinomycetota bacterium]